MAKKPQKTPKRPKDVTQYDLRGIRSDIEVLKHDRAKEQADLIARIVACERRLDALEQQMVNLTSGVDGKSEHARAVEREMAQPIHPPQHAPTPQAAGKVDTSDE